MIYSRNIFCRLLNVTTISCLITSTCPVTRALMTCTRWSVSRARDPRSPAGGMGQSCSVLTTNLCLNAGIKILVLD